MAKSTNCEGYRSCEFKIPWKPFPLNEYFKDKFINLWTLIWSLSYTDDFINMHVVSARANKLFIYWRTWMFFINPQRRSVRCLAQLGLFVCLVSLASLWSKPNLWAGVNRTDVLVYQSAVTRCFLYLFGFTNRRQRKSVEVDSHYPHCSKDFRKLKPMLKFAVNGKLYPH